MEHRNIKILVVYENWDNLVALKALIQVDFPEALVSTAQSAAQCLALASAEDPDMIFLSVGMPMDGYEVCTKLKADQKLRDIPVVFIAALKGDKKSHIKALESGVEAFLYMPIDEIDLTVQIRTMLKIKASNIQKHDDKIMLAALVEEKTRDLKKSHDKTLQLLDAVQKDRALIEAIFDSIPGYLYVYDDRGKLIRWNKKHETMTGYSPEELSHMTLEEWFDPEERVKVLTAVQDIFKKGFGEVEANLILKGGDTMLVRSSGVPLDWDGRQYFMGIGVDITEQKKMQDALLESQSILKAAFENSPTGIAIADAPSGKVRYINKAGLLIRNKTEEEITKDIDIDSYVDSWNILHLDGTPYAKEEVPLTRALLFGETCSEELIIRRDDLEDRYVLANAAPIRDANNIIKAGILVLLDITNRKIMEMQLQRNMDDLLESQRIAHVGTWRLDLATNDVVWSDELYKIYDYDPKLPPPLYTDSMKLFTAESWERLVSSLEQTRISGIPYELELETVSSQGKHGWIWARGAVVTDAKGNTIGLRGAAQDITGRKIIEMQLQQNMDDLLESQRISHLGTWRLDIATDHVTWSDELYKMFGFDPTIPPPPYTDHVALYTAESWEKLSVAFDQAKRFGIPYELEVETISLPGANRWMRVRGEALKNSIGSITGLWGAAQDITESKRVEKELLYLSYHDHLTELFNRRFLEEKLKALDAKRNLPLSVIMCDVNGLKLVNDSFGHEAGDLLLKAAAKIITKASRKDGVVARMGGDEFVIVLPRTTEDEAEHVANTIKELSSWEKVSNIELSISCGYDTKTLDSQSITEVIANAENHMYRHKLYERSSIRSKTIDLIMNTLFEKSNREAMHSNRVSILCQSVASSMKFSKDAVKQMRIAGLIHDIGKIGVDENILNKPGRLTLEERRDIQRHPEIGWKILSSTTEFSELAQFVLNHHENWDGTGYPNGLTGEAIPLEARIISVVDSYDAMTSERSYKTGMSKEDAIVELKRCSGTQFDPDIVEVFVDMVLQKFSMEGQVSPHFQE